MPARHCLFDNIEMSQARSHRTSTTPIERFMVTVTVRQYATQLCEYCSRLATQSDYDAAGAQTTSSKQEYGEKSPQTRSPATDNLATRGLLTCNRNCTAVSVGKAAAVPLNSATVGRHHCLVMTRAKQPAVPRDDLHQNVAEPQDLHFDCLN